MNATSVKDRLKNISKETGRGFGDLLITYGLERTIYRLSISKYKEKFILKGGIFYYALYEGNYPRATADIDFLAQNIGNDLDTIKTVFQEILSVEIDEDPLFYNLETLEVKSITEFKEYHGVNVSVSAFLDRTKIPISIDIGFGDSIYPEKVRMGFPTLLSNETPEVYAYSLYSSLAEKFEAIVSLGYGNSRFKDFYDIYVNVSNNNLDGLSLCNAFKETFRHRGTKIDEIVAFEDDFGNDSQTIFRWNNFVKKKRIAVDVTLNQTISLIKKFVSLILKALKEDSDYTGKWDGETLEWINES